VHLAGSGRVEQADLAHREHLTGGGGPRDVEGGLGVGQCPSGVRPCSSIWMCSTNALSRRRRILPCARLGCRTPAACRTANNVADQPPRSNPTSTRRPSPTHAAQLRDQPAQLGGQRGARSAITTSSGSRRHRPPQVSSVAGRELQPGHMVFAILRCFDRRAHGRRRRALRPLRGGPGHGGQPSRRSSRRPCPPRPDA